MVKADFSGSFLNSDNCKDKEVITIIGKPTVEDVEGQFGNYTKTNIQVEFDGKKKIYSPSNESGIRMVSSWGVEMDQWVGKQFNAEYVKKKVAGKTKTYIEAYPLD
jgi:hypothetical protein